MTIDELNATYRQAGWLIAKRSGTTALKALTLGSEALSKTIGEIGDMYELADEERQLLLPSIEDDAHGGIASFVNAARASVGFPGGISANGAASAPAQQGHLATAAVAIATLGPKAAKAHPIVAAASVAYAVGSAGWFAYHARAFNKAAYELRKMSVEGAVEIDKDPPALLNDHSDRPLLGRLKQFAARGPLARRPLGPTSRG